MKASIVVTCYNYGRYVAATIDSALAQTHPDTEVIVVDDGSTDGSAAIIATYAGRVRSIRQSNQGHVPACNRGFAEATGDLVLFLDADDLLAPEAVASAVAAWRPGVSKVQFDLTHIDASGSELRVAAHGFTPEDRPARMRERFRRTGTYPWPVTVGNAYSRDFLARMFPLDVPMGPDGLLNTVAPVYGEIVTIARPLGFYRLHGANIWSSSGRDLERLKERIEYRMSELDAMRRHARLNSVPLPSVDPLDHELPFINCRLAALKLGLAYQGSAAETTSRLWWCAMRLLVAERTPPRRALAHALWFSALVAVPPRLAPRLVSYRFQLARRARALQWLRMLLGSPKPRGDAA